MPKVAAIICVRMDSYRLPGKALCVYDEASGKTNLECLIDRIKTSRHSPAIIVATGVSSKNDPICGRASSVKDVLVYRSPLSDEGNVVGLFDGAISGARLFYGLGEFDYVWRVMADCPLVDIGLVDLRIDILQRNKLDFLTMLPPEPTYAAQASIWSKEAWDYCAKHSSGSLLEHPGEYLYENYGMFQVARELGPESIYYQDVRTELDTPEDLEFFRRVWKEYPGMITAGHLDRRPDTLGIMRWLSTRPDIVALNHHVQVKTKSTHLHGHHRARNFRCENPVCGNILAVKINESLEVKCQVCGTSRRFHP